MITIEFFAMDSAGNINTASVLIEKFIDNPDPEPTPKPTTISGFNMLFLIIGTMFSILLFLKKWNDLRKK